MTEDIARPIDHTVAHEPGEHALRGTMGTTSVVFMTIACMSPLTAAAGYVSLVVAWGNGLGAPLMYLTVGLVAAIFAVGYLAMVREVARPGGLYAYITCGLGKRIGLGGGFVSMITYLVAQVGLAIFAGISMSAAVSGEFGGPTIPWYWCAAPFIVLATLAAYFNIGLSAKLLGIMLVIELVFVIGFDLVVLARGGATMSGAGSSFTPTQLLSGSVPLAFLFCLSQFSGFESPALYFEETKDPTKTVPRATYAIIAIIATMYCFTAWMLIVGFGADKAVGAIREDSSSAFGTLFTTYLGHGLFQVCTVFIQTGIFASLLAGNNVLSRYLYNCGVDGVLPRVLGRANRRTGAPANASITVGIVLAAFVAAVAATGGDPNQLLALVSGTGTYGFLVMFLLASVAVGAYFSRKSGLTSGRRAVLVGSPAVAGAIFAAVLVYVTRNLSVLIGNNHTFGILLQVIVWACFVGGIAYATFMANRRPDVFARIGREDVAEPVPDARMASTS